MTHDVTFNEMKFYNPNKTDLANQLREQVEQFLEVIEVPYSEPLVQYNLDADSDTDEDEYVNERFENTGQQEQQTEAD